MSMPRLGRSATTQPDLENLLSQLSTLAPALTVLEVTGGDEFEAACALQAGGLAVAVVNPRTTRDFARAMGALARTDALDARMLAAFAWVLVQYPERERFVKPLADAELQRLQALVLRRRQLVQMITIRAPAHTHHLAQRRTPEHRAGHRVTQDRTGRLRYRSGSPRAAPPCRAG